MLFILRELILCKVDEILRRRITETEERRAKGTGKEDAFRWGSSASSGYDCPAGWAPYLSSVCAFSSELDYHDLGNSNIVRKRPWLWIPDEARMDFVLDFDSFYITNSPGKTITADQQISLLSTFEDYFRLCKRFKSIFRIQWWKIAFMALW